MTFNFFIVTSSCYSEEHDEFFEDGYDVEYDFDIDSGKREDFLYQNFWDKKMSLVDNIISVIREGLDNKDFEDLKKEVENESKMSFEDAIKDSVEFEQKYSKDKSNSHIFFTVTEEYIGNIEDLFEDEIKEYFKDEAEAEYHDSCY